MISKGKAWISLPILLSAFIFISYVSYSPKPTQYPSYTIESPSPTGIKALYTYLGKEKNVKKWSHPPNLLGKTKERELLIMAEPLFMPKSEEMQAYLKFMEAGNVILLLKKNPKDFFSINTIPILANHSPDDAVTITSGDGKSYLAKTSSLFRLKANKEDTVLLSNKEGIIALKRTFGEGQLIVSTAPEWITNENITVYNHTNLLFSLLNEEKPTTILFDVYIHGGENAGKWTDLYPRWFLLLVLQGIIIMILLLWRNGKRFGPIYITREETVRFSDERIRALAFLYIRSRSYQESIKTQSDYVKMLMQEKWGIPFNKGWLDLSDLLLQKWRNNSQKDIQAFLKGLTITLTKDKITKQEYLLWSKKLERLRKEVEKK
ncbi:DUF4350 domain-containing protein [Bacillus sp. S/N-304-OC-R1]|uniref:DUF4350 domain-containing protein n=1 Tax=Bacillus sp. S/N-304-OC-R1 TaxID=2758034 RepID=UPI0021AEFD49|nr:DUF4350 domain-containing protein [Bacillus sp. S/N-304-OC-R1]